MDRKYLQECLAKWKTTHAALMDAYLALVKGGVKSYMIDDRQLTRFDLPTLRKQIDECDNNLMQELAKHGPAFQPAGAGGGAEQQAPQKGLRCSPPRVVSSNKSG